MRVSFMEKTFDLQNIHDSLENDDLLNRLEKLSVFLDKLVYQITEDEVPDEDVSKIVDHIKIQKKIYEHAHDLYECFKEEKMEKEKANASLTKLRETLDEYHKFRGI